MKVEQNKMVGVDYKLTVDGQIADQSRPGQPLEFIFGTGMLLPKFEEAILGKEIGEAVSFTLEPKDGYGELIADAVVDLPKNIFMVDGKLAEDILFVGSQVPMSDNQGNRMMGIVKEVGDETVKMPGLEVKDADSTGAAGSREPSPRPGGGSAFAAPPCKPESSVPTPATRQPINRVHAATIPHDTGRHPRIDENPGRHGGMP